MLKIKNKIGLNNSIITIPCVSASSNTNTALGGSIAKLSSLVVLLSMYINVLTEVTILTGLSENKTIKYGIMKNRI
ncbi:MAG: hypothetical protein MRJ93_15005 [Nitrososphaeraceae archaeon]|nr:hypothetical protein [Nitrososphaeraceae archaeon]